MKHTTGGAADEAPTAIAQSTSDRGNRMPHVAQSGARSLAERRFFAAMTIALMAAMVLGFARTFILKPWFPEVQHLAAPEPYFLFHGLAFAAWFALLIVQAILVSTGNVRLHRQLGKLGAGLAVVMVLLGVLGALIAAARPTGFVGVTVPPLVFLVIPLMDMALFAIFVSLAIANRSDPQSHKRYMLLASIAVIEAAVARWPLEFIMSASSPIPGLGMTELLTCLFLVPIVAWDLASRGRVHAVTLWGGLALVAAMALRLPLASTDAWQAFARWAVGLV